MHNPKVTILLTTYNRPALLGIAIQSVLNQDFTDWELIILDDNSSDPAQLEILKPGIVFNDSRITVYNSNVLPEDRPKTARYATLINIGLGMAKGEYVTYLCDDDFYYPDRLKKMVEFLDTNPEKSVVYGQQKIIRVENGEETTSIREADRVLENANCLVDHSSVMHRKSCVAVVGKWDDSPEWWGGADGQYWEKLGKAGFHFYPLAVVTDAHLVHSGSWTREAKWKYLGTEKEGQSGLNTMTRFSIAEEEKK